MTKLFVSYSRVDEDFCEELVELLRDVYGYESVWYDGALHQRGGMNWWETILNEIEEADIFIYLLSNESVQSPYCQAEFTEAQRLNKRIITVQVRDRTKIPVDLSAIQYVDMKNGVDDTRAYNNLIGSITNIMRQPVNKRARWQGRTGRPKLDNDSGKSSRDDVTTPDLLMAQPPSIGSSSTIDKNWGIIATIIIVIILVIGGGIFFANFVNRQNDAQTTEIVQIPSETSNPVGQVEITQAFTDTPSFIIAPDSPSLTPSFTLPDSPTPTLTPTDRPSSTPTLTGEELAMQRALAGVSSNTEWQAFYPDGYVEYFDGVPMLLVPKGCFTIGSEEGDADEMNGNRICFTEPFWIDQTEVTQEQFERLGGEAQHPSRFTGQNHPVESVTWYEAITFCEEQRGARLPTEAQWEYAAVGVNELMYPWGNEFIGANTVWGRVETQGTSDVATHPEGRSWVGAFDMVGNVWEWTSSLFQPYPYNEDDERRYSTELRVFRGGSWGSLNNDLRTTVRASIYPNGFYDGIGFRCAMDFGALEPD